MVHERTKVKFCGMVKSQDIEMANGLLPDYAGFVFAKKSKRCISSERAKELKARLLPDIRAVGVFVNEKPDLVAGLLNEGVIDLAQLHGDEDDTYIRQLKKLTEKPVMQAFLIRDRKDLERAQRSPADMILMDAGAGSGAVFDWKLVGRFDRPYFLAGGLSADNVAAAISILHPYGVDVSSGIEVSGAKNKEKMTAFMEAVRKAEEDDGK